jgi:hypothetical protein
MISWFLAGILSPHLMLKHGNPLLMVARVRPQAPPLGTHLVPVLLVLALLVPVLLVPARY